MKKIISFLLSVVLILSLVPVLPVTEAEAASSQDRGFVTIKKEQSTIAPGITQEIGTVRKNYNKEQLVYYTMKVDLNNPYAHVYANYKDNEWEPHTHEQYGLQTVKDQMDAAQERHKDEPNYTVVGGVNGTGYNMSTGQTRGILVMDGHIVQNDKVNASNNPEPFFGIDRKGQAHIYWNEDGSDWENYKDDLQEAINGFPCNGTGTAPLVRDGDNVVKNMQNVTAARTAIGVTDKNEVIMLVTDGRQSPFSEGCDMYELAEIFIKAGCKDAINLDGGGSTTFVSRPEGEETYRVVNKPCDGAPRAVSASLLVVSTAPDDKNFSRASISADADYITPGGTVDLTAKGLTAAGSPVDLPEEVSWKLDDESFGTVTGEGANAVFQASDSTGDVVVQMMLEGNPNPVGEVTIHIVKPSTFSFATNSYSVPYGKSIDIGFKATYKINDEDGDAEYDVKLRDEGIQLSLEQSDGLGELSGLQFTARQMSKDDPATLNGTLKATLQGTELPAVSADLVVGRDSEIIVSFDSDDPNGKAKEFSLVSVSSGNTWGIKFEDVNETTGKVHDGDGALKVTVDFRYLAANLEGSGSIGNGGVQWGKFTSLSSFKGAEGVGFWMWVPDDDLWMTLWFNVLANGSTIREIIKLGPDADEGRWIYVYRALSAGTTGKLPPEIFTFYLDKLANASHIIKSTASQQVFYIDSISVDYSPVKPDREMPVIGDVQTLTHGDTYGTLERRQVFDCGEKDSVMFVAAASDPVKANSTGIDHVEAYIDGVQVGASYSNGKIFTEEVKLPAGVHTLKLYAVDGANNRTNVTRQFRINKNEVPTVKVVGSEKNKFQDFQNRVPIGGVYYVDVVATDVTKVQSVSVDLELNNASFWEDQHIEVNPKFTYEWKYKDFHAEDEKIGTLTITRKDGCEWIDDGTEDSNVLASIPIRTWGYDYPNWYKGWSSFGPKEAWKGKYFGPQEIKVQALRGEIGFIDGFETDVENTFSGDIIQVDTELFDYASKVLAANPGKESWHVHSATKEVQSIEPTCTTNGLKDRKECPECHSPVSDSDWGEFVPALGHDYKLIDGVMKCSRVDCGVLLTGVKDGIAYINGETVEGWQEDGTYYENGKPLSGLHEVTEEDGETERWHEFDATGACIDKEDGYTGYYTGTDGYYTAVDKLPDAEMLKNTAYYYVEGGLPYDGWLFFNRDGEKHDNTETTDPGTGDGGDADVDPDANPEDPNGGNKDEGQQKLGEIIGYHVHSDGRIYGSTQVDTRKCVESGYIRYFCDGCDETKDSQWLWWVGHDWDENHVCKREGCGFHGLNIADASLNIMGKRFNYTGQPIRAAVYVYHDSKSLSVRSDKNGLDGYVWYSNNVEIGEATVHIRGEGNYYGEISGTFEIVPQSVKKVEKTESNGSADKVTVTLNWEECLGADYYDVYRYDYDAGQWIIERVDAPATTFSEELALGTKYDYRVASRAQRGEKIYYSALWPEAVYGTIDHVWGEETNRVEPQCEIEGSYEHKCELCGFTETVTVPATGHKVEEWETTVEPTYSSAGSRTGECSVCHETVTEEIPQLPPVITGTGNTTSPDAKQETVTNEDGSTTTTTTKPDGSKTETTTQTDGTVTEKNTEKSGVVTETTTKPDNTVTEKVTQTDGSATEKTTTPDGVVGQKSTDAEGKVTSAEVVIPKEAEKQDVVTAPVEVPAAKSAAEAPEISVRTESSESKKVEIPVTEFGPGTVAVVVNPDGTEEIVRDCVMGENGVVLNVEGDVTLKIVDNTETFEDVEEANHWATDAVEFVAARELFNGTGENKFTPNGAMTRGMMVTVLYRLAYEPDTVAEQFADVPSGQYYSDAVAWAQNAGVVTGYDDNTFAPDDNVKREQLVTILYRYAKKMGYATTASGTLAGYADASSVSGWAKDAMSWAIDIGLVNGVDATHLAPANNATRAEVATILMRFCEKVVK